MLLPANFPVGSATAPGFALVDTFGASTSATDAARHRAQNSKSALVPPAASLTFRHLGSSSCVPEVRGLIEPLPDACAPDIRPAPSRFWLMGFQNRSCAPQTGFQYCAVDSITASSTSCSSSHAEGDRGSSGRLPKSRRSNSYSPSPPTSDTTTASLFLWTSIPA